MDKSVAEWSDSLPFWGQLRETEREALAGASVCSLYRAGALLHAGQADCTGLYMVLDGQLRAFIVSDAGREITLYRLLALDICLFSASCMFKDIQFDLSVQAMSDTRALRIPADAYQHLMEQSMPVALFTHQLMAARFSDVMWLLEQVLFKRFDTRLATFLLEQSNIDGAARLALTHEEIARHLGSAREVVSRMMKYFQSEGIVAMGRGEIDLIDFKKLRELADG
ncbi:MAG: Crp/Fnr family transcriptional regulator [Clostridiales bacterium]|nr:Crp/Fnr family transcriptional regulator [Clostridiales bacterium]